MIREQIKSKLIESMKAKDEKVTGTLRLINAAIKDKDIEARPKGITEIDDTAILSLLQSMIKQRKESIDMYQKGGRSDLAANEQSEIDVIQSFLPKQMTDEEIKSAIETIISETGASSVKDMGKVMGVLKSKYAGQLDMGKASALIKGLLG